jgi:hypothetical protein
MAITVNRSRQDYWDVSNGPISCLIAFTNYNLTSIRIQDHFC